MSLYLCVFEKDSEVDGVDVGRYSDFAEFRHAVHEQLEKGSVGSRFPVLLLHSDCDGMWSPQECTRLKAELETIRQAFTALPGVELPSGWRKDVAKLLGIKPSNLHECFFDVDGEPLVDRLIDLCQVAIEVGSPILFQ
jgi:hypothetical protein